MKPNRFNIRKTASADKIQLRSQTPELPDGIKLCRYPHLLTG
ncbi:hypothetical protein AB1A64_01160 [Ruegeria sp. ANG10]